MKVFYSFTEAEGNIENSVVTIGMFDGVHIGHKTIINHIKKIASEIGGEATLITFWPHPRQVLSNDYTKLKLINTLEEKINLLSQTGLQNLIVHPFTIEFSKTSSNDFLQNYIAKTLKAKAMVVGKNHYFGHNREGNFELIQEFASKFSIVAHQIPLELIDSETISSAKIREALSVGNIFKANQLLEYDYFVTGIVSDAVEKKRFHFIPSNQIKLLPAQGEYNCLLLKGEENYECRSTIFLTNNGQETIIVDLRENIEIDHNLPLKLIFKKF